MMSYHNSYDSVCYEPSGWNLSYHQSRLKRGTQVRLSYPFNGSNAEQNEVLGLLELDKDYTVSDIYISSKEVSIWFNELPHHYFNGLQFTLSSDNKIADKYTRLKFNLKRLYRNIKKTFIKC